MEYRAVAAEELAHERPAAFDLVTCMEMLEHVPDPAAIVEALAALARPGGDIIVSTLNRNPLAFAVAIVGAEYIARVLPRGTHEYLKFIRPSELARWGRRAGLELRDSDRHHLQSVDACVSALAEYQRQLPGALYQGACLSIQRGRDRDRMSLPLRAMLFDMDGTVLDTAPDMVARAECAARRARSRADALR